MTTAQMSKVPESGGIQDVAQLFATLSPLFGTGKTNTNSTSQASADTGSMGQADELLQQLMGNSQGQAIDDMVQNILTRAKQEFGPAVIAGKAAGVRGYSDSVRQQMAGEAMARATGEAAKAKLDAINANNRIAAGLVEAKIGATKRVQNSQAQRTGASPLGQGLAVGLAGAQIYSKVKGKPSPTGPNIQNNASADVMSSEYGYSGGEFDSAFQAAADNPAGDASFFGEAGGGTLGVNAAALDGNAIVADAANPPVDITPVTMGSSAPVESAALAPAGDVAAAGTGAMVAGTAMPAAMATPGAMMPPAIAADAMMPAAILDPTLTTEAGGELAADVTNTVDFSTITPDIATDAATTVTTDAAVEGAADFALPPGTFTIANALTGGAISDFVGEGVGFLDEAATNVPILGDVYDRAIAPFDDLANSIFGGCFMTTAATNGGELDNGFTLETMRRFRSTFMQETPERKSEIFDYYLLAPLVVKRINESRDPDAIWTKIREDYLAPCVWNFHLGMPEETYEIYKKMMYWARQQVGLARTD